MDLKTPVDYEQSLPRVPQVEYRNLLSRLLLRKEFELQFGLPFQEPPAIQERFYRWYERRALDVDVSAIQIDRPIFLVGVPRSGTTMLQDIICARSDLAYYTNSMHQYRRCFCAAEDLRKRLRLDFTGERYLFDGVQVKPGSANEGAGFLLDWLGIDLYSPSPENDRGLQAKPVVPDRTEKLQETIRKAIWCFGGQARRFFNKAPTMLRYLRPLQRSFPDARVIHLVRDPRMVANSMIKLYHLDRLQEARIRPKLRKRAKTRSTFIPYPHVSELQHYLDEYGPDDIRTTANVWNDSISMVNAVKNELPFFYELRYEDILVNPRAEMKKLLEFCELPDDEDSRGEFWHQVAKIRTGGPKVGRYADFDVVEAICHANMQKYGYL